MDFILNKNTRGLVLNEEMFYWVLDEKKITSQEEVIEALKNKAEFNTLMVSHLEDEHTTFEFKKGTGYAEWLISVLEDRYHETKDKYMFNVGMYAENIDDDYANPFELSGPLLVNGKYITANSGKEAFDMLGEVIDIIISKLENYSPEEDEE